MASGGGISWQEQFESTSSDITRIYKESIEPVEEVFQYEVFRPSYFSETLKPTKPFILFVGPFSAGKSTFINYLLGHDHLWTGPQPTTDKFTVIMHGFEVNTIPGRVLTSNANLPFRGLAEFGNDFVENFSGLQAPSEVLRSVSFIDTPGVLESSKEVHRRSYNYAEVCKFFIDRSDLVFVVLDPSKLDCGDELRALFRQFRGAESKVRIVLNKADTVSPSELLRVYGAVFWSLSNLVQTTEPPRVYVSSFWNRPYTFVQNTLLFDQEKADLIYEMVEAVPVQCLDKRVAALMKRALDVQIHAHVVGLMRERLPSLFGKHKAQQKMLKNLKQDLYEEIHVKYKLCLPNFPDPEEYVKFFERPMVHLKEFPKFSSLQKRSKSGEPSLLDKLNHAVTVELPKLLQPIQQARAVDPREVRKNVAGDSAGPLNKLSFLNVVNKGSSVSSSGSHPGAPSSSAPGVFPPAAPAPAPLPGGQGVPPPAMPTAYPYPPYPYPPAPPPYAV
eukprot:RCo004953